VRWGLLLFALLCPTTARAVPGPDSVAVVANATITESVRLAERYAMARDIPDRHVCTLDLPTAHTIDLATYEDRFAAPLEACLEDRGVLDRIEALVLTKGVPLRVRIPTGDRNRRASLAAVAAAWKSTTLAGRPLVGGEPGVQANCGGTPCYAARYRNPFEQGLFEAGWVRSMGSVIWRPLIVTALEGRSYEDAARLVASATTAEANPPARGDFVFMRGRDGARGVLDAQFPAVVDLLEDLGFDAEILPFDPNLEGRDLAAFFVGTSTLSRTIEGNRYLPGSLVDNLTSFGAVPRNFEPSGESQVSIARWVAQGVAGVHGTTDEPLNNVFPSRRLVVDYVAGGTLGEAYFRRLPFAYWRNLVLGDPMTAPYAVRPEVSIAGVTGGERVVGARLLDVEVVDPLSRGIASSKLFVDGVLVDEVAGDRMSTCVVPPEGDSVQILVVAQVEDDLTPEGFHRPKGWAGLRIAAEAGSTTCDAADAGVADARPDAGRPDLGPADAGPVDASDAAAPDAGPDAGTPPADAGSEPTSDPNDDGGCRCIGSPSEGSTRSGVTLVLALIALAAARRPSARSRVRMGRR
jgi:hypothetical protein